LAIHLSPQSLTFHPQSLTFHPQSLTPDPQSLTFSMVSQLRNKGLDDLEIESMK